MQNGLTPKNVSATSGTFTNASVTSATITTGTITTASGNNFLAAGSVNAVNYVLNGAGSPYGAGVIIPFTAQGVVSGGKWVCGSANKVYAGVEQAPIGVSVPGTNVAASGTVNVIVLGVVPLIAEATVATGVAVVPGAGTGLNTVKPAADGSGTKYCALGNAGSEGTLFVLIR